GQDRLASVLHGHGVDEWCIDALLEILNRSFGSGVPIGPAASHILAEAFLIEVDTALADQGMDHIRFADDYRMFSPDLTTARRWIDILDNFLRSMGLELRPDKTSIENVSRFDYANGSAQSKLGLFADIASINQRPKPGPKSPVPPCPPSGCRRPRRP